MEEHCAQYEVELRAAVPVYVDSSDMDIIQSTLQQSSLSLEDGSNTLDLSNTAPSFMDNESVAVPAYSSPLSEVNISEEDPLKANGDSRVTLVERCPKKCKAEGGTRTGTSSGNGEPQPYMYDSL